MKRMIHTILALCLSLIVCASINTIDEINAIKKSPDYLYGDATMGTLQDAEKLAKAILQDEMFRWLSENHHPIDSAKILRLCKEADTLTMRRADQYRVFAYVPKTVFFQLPTSKDPAPKQPVQKQDEPKKLHLSPKILRW